MFMNMHWNKGQSEMTSNVMLSDPTQRNLWSDIYDLILMRLVQSGIEIHVRCPMFLHKRILRSYFNQIALSVTRPTSRKLLRIKVTPDLHLTYSKNGGIWGWY